MPRTTRTFNPAHPVPEDIAARAYLRADAALALTASVVSQLPCLHHPAVSALRRELLELGYQVQ